jgi:hypothetical protein
VRKRGREGEGGRGIEGGRVGSWRTGRGAINGGAAAGGGKLWRRKQHDVRKGRKEGRKKEKLKVK